MLDATIETLRGKWRGAIKHTVLRPLDATILRGQVERLEEYAELASEADDPASVVAIADHATRVARWLQGDLVAFDEETDESFGRVRDAMFDDPHPPKSKRQAYLEQREARRAAHKNFGAFIDKLK